MKKYYVIKTHLEADKADNSMARCFDNKKDAKEYCELKNKAYITQRRIQEIENNEPYIIQWVYIVVKEI